MSVTIRITAKLAKRTKEAIATDPPASTGVLGDWYANLLYIKRQQFILAVSEKSLLPLLMPAKNANSFPLRLRETLVESLETLEVPKVKIDSELAEMSSWTFAKTANRQVLGVMTDFAKALDHYTDFNETIEKLQARLATTPCSPIGMNYPIERACELFGMAAPRTDSLSKSHLRLVRQKDERGR